VKRKSAAIAYLEADEKRAKHANGEERDESPTADALMTKIAAFIEKAAEQNKPTCSCYRCGTPGHIARNCHLPPPPQQPDGQRGNYRGGFRGRWRGRGRGRGGYSNNGYNNIIQQDRGAVETTKAITAEFSAERKSENQQIQQ
jgi:hypothetical protein